MAARKLRRTVARRKKPRTAAQKRATKKLIAFNKERGFYARKRKRSPGTKAALRKRTTRKKPRTAAQKRATAKLVALNKRRLKARNKARRKPARKKRPLSPAARRAWSRRKKARKQSHAYVIKVIVATPKKHTRWYTGKGFVKAADRIDHPPKRFATKEGASAECIKIAPKLPASISSIRIVKL